MKDQYFKSRIIDYVLARKCRTDGFCFYRLEEPNGSDTFFALSVLNLLGAEFEDRETVTYLRRMQHSDGSYDSIYSAYYSIKSLSLLGADPEVDPRVYLAKTVVQYRFDARRLPADVGSLFKRTSYLVDLYKTTGIDDGNNIRECIIEFILSFQNENGGFGCKRSTIYETSSALSMLDRFGCPVQTLETESFIRRCEDPLYGFTDIPHTTLSYLEYVHAGVLASSIISYKPRYIDQCMDFVKYCQNKSGGFSRTANGGIATLENTFYAVHALTLLSPLQT